MQGYCRKIIPFSSVDGPGNRTVIFLQGCNFHCFYCHNPETQPLGDGGQPDADVVSRDHMELLAQVLLYRDFIRGVTLSGGECTVQLPFLMALCQELQNNKIEVFIDTNGHLAHEDFRRLCQYVDACMFDIKAMDEAVHLQLTGQSNSLVLQNLRYAIEHKKIYEIRTVIVPDLLPNSHTVIEASRLISRDPSIRYKLIKFRPRGVQALLPTMHMPSDDFMVELCTLAKSCGVATCLTV